MATEEICCCDQVPVSVPLDGIIRYLNTDLDLRSAEDLTPLAMLFISYGMGQNHLRQGDDGNWFAIFETDGCCAEPNQTITLLLEVIEALTPEHMALWSRCTVKEFNLGYQCQCQCGTEPRPFTRGLSSEVVARIAAVGASLRITLYPDYTQLANQAHGLDPAVEPDADGRTQCSTKS